MPYEAGSWAGMEQALDMTMPIGGAASGGSSWGWYAAGGALLIAGAAALYSIMPNDETVVAENQDLAVVEQTVVENDSPEAIATSANKGESPISASINDENEEQHSSSTRADELATSTSETSAEKTTEENEVASTVSDEKPKEVKMNVEPTFMMNFIPSSTKVCEGESVSFLNTATETNASYSWDFGDGTTAISKDADHTFATAGSYVVKLTGARKNSDQEITQRITVHVLPKPTAEFAVEPNQQSAHLVSLNTSLIDGQKAEWTFSDMKRSQAGATVQHLFRDRGDHTITLTIINDFGCMAKVSEAYSVPNDLPMERFAANTFTPDGDGTNDRFYIPTLKLLDVPFTLTITDNSGRVVFQTSDKDASWNGVDQNTGNPVANGPCGWQIIIENNYLDRNTFTGSVQLKRN